MNMPLTPKEVWTIENIISAEHTGNNYHLPHWKESFEEANQGATWSDCVELGGAKHGEKCSGKVLSGVCASLVKKGYAWSDSESIGITREGWEAYQNWCECKDFFGELK